ncbi:hypothetical protein [Microvirga subterranea]|uniref:Uncharacterized protein n=1 Tax=Microvirga subterranea TaxID=186651 RepID=A0A370HJN3_9HYPH|nr:hypothetical protein [Microvirga subterranea]RDI58699.1 hypothetical protein DES45_105222 [Microvirga subterranea]
MITGAAFVALVMGALAYVSGDSSTFLVNLAEIIGVIALFALVCATESISER